MPEKPRLQSHEETREETRRAPLLAGGPRFCWPYEDPPLFSGGGAKDLRGVTLIGKLNPWVVLKSNKIKELWRPRSLLYRRRFLRPNTHFAAFFDIYMIQKPLHRSKRKILQNFNDNFLKICQILTKFSFNFQEENV